MTDRIALWLALAIVAVVGADLFHFGWDLHILLGRRLIGLIDSLAIWR